MAYVLPQVKVFQQFRQISQDVVGNLNACIIGPHYILARYDQSSEKALTKLGAKYTGMATGEIDYPGGFDQVDKNYVKVFFENITAKYADLQNPVYSVANGPGLFSNYLDVESGFVTGSADDRATTVAFLAAPSVLQPDLRVSGKSGDKYYVIPEIQNSAIDEALGYVYVKDLVTGDVVRQQAALDGSEYSAAGLSVNHSAFDGKTAQFCDFLAFTTSDARIILRPEYTVEFLEAVKAAAKAGTLPADLGGPVLVGEKVEELDVPVVTPIPVPGTSIVRYKLSFNSAWASADFLKFSVFNKYFMLAGEAPNDDLGGLAPMTVTGIPEGLAIATLRSIGDTGVAVGDTARGIYNSNPVSATIKAFQYADDGSAVSAVREVGSDSFVSSVHPLLRADLFSVKPGRVYSGPTDATYIITVLGGGGSVWSAKVTEKNSLDAEYTVTVESGEFPVGSWKDTNGNRLVLQVNGSLGTTYDVQVGQMFEVRCFTAKNKIVKCAELLNVDGFSTTASVEFTSLSLSSYYGSAEVAMTYGGHQNWMASANKIQLYSDIRANVNGKDVTVSSADVFVQFRALETKYAGTIHEVRSTNEVQVMLGTIGMDNPLAQGCYHALLNSGDQPVYFIALNSDDQPGYDKALERLELVKSIYSIVPMTSNDAVLDDVQAHVEKMSGADSKKWRIAVVGQSTDYIVPIYRKSMHPIPGQEYHAVISGDELTFDSDDETLCRNDVQKGDEVRYDFYNGVARKTAKVKSVLNNTQLVLEDPVDHESFYGVVEIWRELESAEWINYVANKISAFSDRRMYSIFPEVLWNNGNEYPGYIGAAAVAGLISSVPPQQGLTNIALNGFDDIPTTYKNYTRTQLDHIADYGGLIIMQDEPEGEVYIRHQVSTAARDGNLLTTELSVTKDLDAISYYMSDILDPFTGKYNITPVLLEQIRTTVQGALNYLGSYNTGAGLLGPMLLADSEDTKIVGIRQHETLKNHIIVSVTLDLPLPCNVIELYLSV